MRVYISVGALEQASILHSDTLALTSSQCLYHILSQVAISLQSWIPPLLSLFNLVRVFLSLGLALQRLLGLKVCIHLRVLE